MTAIHILSRTGNLLEIIHRKRFEKDMKVPYQDKWYKVYDERQTGIGEYVIYPYKKIPIIKVIPMGLTGKGSFISGTKWKTTHVVKVGNKTFRKGQIVHWIDSDYGIRNNDKYQEYKFKIGYFMVYDDNIDIMPVSEKGKNVKTGKWEETVIGGRISLKDIAELEEIKENYKFSIKSLPETKKLKYAGYWGIRDGY